MLAKLPTEILFKIFDSLQSQSLANLLPTCDRFMKIIVPKYCIPQLRDIGWRRDPLLRKRWAEEIIDIFNDEAVESMDFQDMYAISKIYREIVTEMPNSLENIVHMEEKTLGGVSFSRRFKEADQIVLFGDKIIISTYYPSEVQIFSLITHHLLKTFQRRCFEEGKLLISDNHLLVIDMYTFWMINLDTLEDVAKELSSNYEDMLLSKPLQCRINNKAIVITTDSEALIWSRENDMLIAMPFDIEADFKPVLNDNYLVLFGMDRHHKQRIFTLKFYEEEHENLQKVCENVWIDCSVTHQSKFPDKSQLGTILLNENNLLAYIEYLEYETNIVIFDVANQTCVSKFDCVTRIHKFGCLTKDYHLRYPFQWQGDRLFFQISSDGQNCAKFGYWDVRTTKENIIDCTKELDCSENVWFGISHVVELVTADDSPTYSDDDNLNFVLKYYRCE